MDRQRMSRRAAIVRIGGLVATVGAGAACSSFGPSTQTGAPAQQTGRSGLVFGIVQPILTLAPYPNTTTGVYIRRTMWDTLVSMDGNRNPVPELAESWQVSDDRRSITLNLRSGVAFHSGRMLTATDVKWNLDFLKDPKTQTASTQLLADARITVRDRNKVDIVLPEPLPQLFSALSAAVILDPESDPFRNPAGTGPFKLDSFTPGDELQLSRHTGYWKPGQPRLDRLTVRILPDPSALLVNLESGAVDVAYPVPLNEVGRIQSGSRTTVALNPMAGNQAYLVRVDEAPFTDKRVRQATYLAMDRQRCVETALKGYGSPSSVVWPKASPAWDAAMDTPDFNLERASQLLTEAGAGGGFETSITASRTFAPDMFTFHQILQADLAKIGVRANLNVVEENVRSKQINDRNFSGLIHYGAGGADLDPAALFDSAPLRPKMNTSHYESVEYARLVDAARLEPDSGRRKGLYRDLTQLVKDEAFFLPVANPLIPHGVRREVQGLEFTVGLPAAVNFANAWLS